MTRPVMGWGCGEDGHPVEAALESAAQGDMAWPCAVRADPSVPRMKKIPTQVKPFPRVILWTVVSGATVQVLSRDWDAREHISICLFSGI